MDTSQLDQILANLCVNARDANSPEMNGRELAENMRTHYPAFKVLFMSG